MGDLKRDSGSNLYDEELMGKLWVSKKKKRIQNQQLSTWQVQRMNTPIKKYIRTIKSKYGALSMDRSYTQTSLWIQ
jgi:hypothetical protein